MNKITDKDLELLKQIYPNDFQKKIEELNNNYPIQYLIGYVDFYGYKINVNNNVLIPRFETEYLVKDVIDLIKIYNINQNIIDICTGSGCIAIALSKELNIEIDAIDISKDAIEVAKDNASINKASVNYINQDIKLFESNKKYNVLVSNPPYVKKNEEVSPETKYEPSIALYADNNGLEFYDIILKKSKDILYKNNLIAFEIGSTLKDEIINLIKKYYPKAKIITKKDLNNYDRYIYIINNE